jgi:2-polyprenyl-3-methyl-5-hydroxy-6-metoxy-1,4-benzoquinol methylase
MTPKWTLIEFLEHASLYKWRGVKRGITGYARLPGRLFPRHRDAGWWEALWPDPAGVLAAVGLRPGMDVIDLCAGDGWFTLQIARVARHVSAIDIGPNLLEVARHRLAESGVTSCDFIAGDACDIAKLAGPADFVFMANAFHGVPDRTRLAQGVASALKADSHFAIINCHRRPREETPILGEPRGPKTELRMSPEETIRSVEGRGLKFAKTVEVPPYHYGVLFHRVST